MKILITGSAGHIGTNIAIEALNRGHRVVAMDNLHREQVVDNLRYLQTTFTKYGFDFVWGDVRNADDFDRVPEVDAIIHLAANPGIPWSIKWPTYDFETNARGTLNALEFARKMGNIPFIYASTNKTFSDIINKIPVVEQGDRYKWTETRHTLLDRNNKNYTELSNRVLKGIDFNGIDTPLAINQNFPVTGFGKYSHSMYGISKLTGELYATEYHCQYGLPVVINKMSCIYGLFQKGAIEQGWINFMLRTIYEGDRKITFFGSGKQVRDILDARDVARLYIDELEQIGKCNGEVFTVGGGINNTVSLIEAVKAIEDLVGKKAIISYKDKRPADQDIYISSLKLVNTVMKWKPEITFETTLKDMLNEIR